MSSSHLTGVETGLPARGQGMGLAKMAEESVHRRQADDSRVNLLGSIPLVFRVIWLRFINFTVYVTIRA